jgi:hypothetical protein
LLKKEPGFEKKRMMVLLEVLELELELKGEVKELRRRRLRLRRERQRLLQRAVRPRQNP